MSELVSVIMPVHNAERFIEDAIRSVMAQTYDNWELLVVDDASTDHSMAIVKNLVREDNRIKLITNNNPTGYPATPRNMAVNEARGRFIAFLDSDDMWLPDKLERQLPLFEKHAKVAVVFSNYEKVNEFGERAKRVVVAPRRVSYRRLLLGNVIGNVTGVYDTRRVGKVYFPQVRHEDYAMWLSILKRGYLAYNQGEVTALYRVSSNSVSSQKLHLLSWQWKVYRNVEKLNFFSSVYYYANYAVRAFIKSLI
ncbi:MAG: glycosyltransferase family 2 protein [Bacteroidaceae bacterium]|nr:glycosyltransferase family 2 protein [Bacteroidaceae bacterium]